MIPYRIIDISTSIDSNTRVYSGDPTTHIEKMSSVKKHGLMVSKITLGTHTGTHVDAPAHIFEKGKGIDTIDPGSFIGKAVVLDLSSQKGEITEHEISANYKVYSDEKDISVLLIKTFEGADYNNDCPGPGCKDPSLCRILTPAAGIFILEYGFKVIGVDTLSVDLEGNLQNHQLFLKNGVNIVEHLDLSTVGSGIYFFVCLPLKLIGADGAPARAILMDSVLFD